MEISVPKVGAGFGSRSPVEQPSPLSATANLRLSVMKDGREQHACLSSQQPEEYADENEYLIK